MPAGIAEGKDGEFLGREVGEGVTGGIWHWFRLSACAVSKPDPGHDLATIHVFPTFRDNLPCYLLPQVSRFISTRSDRLVQEEVSCEQRQKFLGLL